MTTTPYLPSDNGRLLPELTLIRNQRRSLAVFGALFTLLGIGIARSPDLFFQPVAFLISIALISSGLLKAFQFFLGRTPKGYSFRNAALILAEILLDISIGILFLNHDSIAFRVIALLLGLLFLLDGGVQLAIAVRARGVKARVLFFLNAIFTLALGSLTLILLPSLNIRGAALLIGIRMVSFGLVLISMSFRSHENRQSVIYREVDTTILRRRKGELYACYFGAAFHLGVYIGNNEVVHYRDDNIVHRTSWEEFLRGREPQHWVYPDLSPAPVTTVVATAIKQVGKQTKYNVITNNCEHFAIHCKTGGVSRTSQFAQTSATLRNLQQRPFVAIFVEVYTRIGEWIAFHFGGAFGRKLSFRIRRFNSMVTAWMLSR